MRNICFSYGHNKSSTSQHRPGAPEVGKHSILSLGPQTERSPKAMGKAFGDSDPELWFAECYQYSHAAAQCAVVPSPSSPTVTHTADVAKHSLCHHACRKPSTTAPMMNQVSLPSFISVAMCPLGGCVSRHLCTSSSPVVQDSTLDFNPLEPFEFVHSLLKLVCEAKIH